MRVTPNAFFLLLLLLVLGFGCHREERDSVSPPTKQSEVPKPDAKGGAVFPGTFTYGINGERKITLSKSPERIVSLSPAITETLFAIRAEGQLVAVTSACDYPPAAKQKPNIGGYPLSVERILSFKPEVVIGDASLNKATLAALDKLHVPVFLVDSVSLGDVFRTVSELSRLTGKTDQTPHLLRNLGEQLRPYPVTNAAKLPKVLMVYGTNPIFTTGPGTMIDEVIRAAGGRNAVSARVEGDRVTPEQAIALQPDVILCSPELIPALKTLPGFANGVPAVRNNRFYSVGNAAPLVRPGPRIGQAKLALQHFLHP